ncbi:hypothetical protein ABZ474_47955, partial [Streptomyces mirabilis]
SPPEMEQHHRHHNDLTSNNTLSIKELQLPCQWKSEGSRHYEARLTEARKLLTQLAEGYHKAAGALSDYAFALEVAKAHYSNGKANEQSLANLIHTKGTAITREAQEAEPMRQWEDMRSTTGVMDFFAELTMDVDDIRDDANRLHDAAGGDFHLAKTTEHEARESASTSSSRRTTCCPTSAWASLDASTSSRRSRTCGERLPRRARIR